MQEWDRASILGPSSKTYSPTRRPAAPGAATASRFPFGDRRASCSVASLKKTSGGTALGVDADWASAAPCSPTMARANDSARRRREDIGVIGGFLS